MAETQTPTEASTLTSNGDLQNGAESQLLTSSTPNSDVELFSEGLISPQVSASLQEVGYTIRPLRKSDYATGVLEIICRRPCSS